MIEAIVFLPLIGAILAGLIALAGAHRRNPSGDTVDHHDHSHAHAATAHAWRNGWFHTGDAFRQDADGNFYFVDRLKDAIRGRAESGSPPLSRAKSQKAAAGRGRT